MTLREQIANLKALAEAATPGYWVQGENNKYASSVRLANALEYVIYVPEACPRCDQGCLDHQDAAFIAAANPQTILALTALLDEARELADAITHGCPSPDSHSGHRCFAYRARTWLDKLNEEVK